MYKNKGFKFLYLSLILSLLFGLIVKVDIFAANVNDTLDIQIIASSDLHGRFMPYEYASDLPNTKGSLAQIATKVKELKAQNPNTLVLDNGDTIQDNSSQLFLNDSIHPMIQAMNLIGYDTWNFGNHEFNYGVPALQKVASEFKGTVLCGNLYKDGKRLYDAYAIKTVAGVRVAIIGMVTPYITKWDGPNLVGYDVKSPTEETRKVIDEIKSKNLADIYIATIHQAYDGEYGGDSAKDVADKNPEISAVIAGHEHALFSDKTGGNAIIIEPGKYGENLAKVDLTVQKSGSTYTVVDKKAENIKMDGVTADSELEAALTPAHEKALADARQVIGQLVDGDLSPDDEVKGIVQAQVQDTALVDLINTVQLYYGNENKAVPDGARRVSSAALFDANANCKQGQILKADTAKIYKYDNTLYTLKINGGLLKKYMEWSVSYYNQFKPGDLTISFDPNIRIYNYDMFSEVDYKINISKPAGSRIEGLVYSKDKVEVKDSDIIYLTCNNYRANTQLINDLFKDSKDVEVVYDSSSQSISAVRDLIGKYIKEVKGGKIATSDFYTKNWELTGYSYDNELRTKAVELVNSGKINIPTSEDGRTPNVRSLTAADLTTSADVTPSADAVASADATASADVAAATSANKKITLVSVNDFHGNVEESGKNVGIAKLADAVDKIKKDNPNTVFLGSGDLFQGSAPSNLTKGAVVNDILKKMGMVVSAVGNHEFDWGVDLIPKWSKDGGYDFLASNIYDKTTGQPVTWAKPTKVIDIDGVKIGLIGIATPETAYKTTPENVANIEFRDPAESATHWAKVLKEQCKVDAVIALTHLGGMQDSDTKEITGEIVDFANNVKDVDAVFFAHTHQFINGEINGIPVVQGGYYGRGLAEMNLAFDDTNKLVSIDTKYDELFNRTDLAPNAEVKAILDSYIEKLGPILNEVIGNAATEYTHDTDNMQVTPMGQLSSMLLAKAGDTQIAIFNGGGIRTSLNAGDITMGEMYQIFPFDNTLVTMKLKGSDLKKVIEHGIMSTDFRPGQFYGINVWYDSTKEAGSRITHMELLDGTPIDMNKDYTVSSIDFLMSGGDKYDFSAATDVKDTMIPLRDKLVEIIKEMKTVDFKYEENLINGPAPAAKKAA